MINISTYNELKLKQKDLAFLDVKLDDDNELFIDPRLIENSSSQEFSEFKDCLSKYFGNLVLSIVSDNKSKSLKLMSGISEPFETRLGYGINNSNGSSIGNKLKIELLNSLRSNTVLKSKSLRSFAEMGYFLEGIGCDRISDFTTKIVKKHLISFTQKQCQTLGITMRNFDQLDIFNYITMEWEAYNVELPFYFDGINYKPIIFVPKQFVRREKDANSDLNCFYRFARNYIRFTDDGDFLKGIIRNGKDNSVLAKDFDDSIDDYKKELSKWVVKYPIIMKDYWGKEASNIKPLTDKEISEVVYYDRRKAA